MQKLRYAILLVALFFVLILWATHPDETIEAETMRTTAEQTAAQMITEAELIDLFYGYAYADPANRVVTGCAIMAESDHGIIGVVQYTAEDYGGCLFDFLRREGPPLQAEVEGFPIANSLQFTVKDTVTCGILGKDGTAYDCRISVYQSDMEYGFKLETTQKEG